MRTDPNSETLVGVVKKIATVPMQTFCDFKWQRPIKSPYVHVVYVKYSFLVKTSWERCILLSLMTKNLQKVFFLRLINLNFALRVPYCFCFKKVDETVKNFLLNTSCYILICFRKQFIFADLAYVGFISVKCQKLVSFSTDRTLEPMHWCNFFYAAISLLTSNYSIICWDNKKDSGKVLFVSHN